MWNGFVAVARGLLYMYSCLYMTFKLEDGPVSDVSSQVKQLWSDFLLLFAESWREYHLETLIWEKLELLHNVNKSDLYLHRNTQCAAYHLYLYVCIHQHRSAKLQLHFRAAQQRQGVKLPLWNEQRPGCFSATISGWWLCCESPFIQRALLTVCAAEAWHPLPSSPPCSCLSLPLCSPNSASRRTWYGIAVMATRAPLGGLYCALLFAVICHCHEYTAVSAQRLWGLPL